MSSIMRREGVFTVSIIVAAIMILNFFISIPILKSVSQEIQVWALIIQLIAIGIGAVNMMRSHLRIITRRTPGRWYFSAWLIILFVLMTIVGVYDVLAGTTNPVYDWIFTHVYVSLGTTLYAVTGFYIFSAAFRAFRARTAEAAVMLVAGCLMFLTNAPFGEAIWSGFPVIGGWLMEYGQIPWQRVVTMVEAFGMLAFGYRAFVGKERGFYGGATE
jgi:hypothetical protein